MQFELISGAAYRPGRARPESLGVAPITSGANQLPRETNKLLCTKVCSASGPGTKTKRAIPGGARVIVGRIPMLGLHISINAAGHTAAAQFKRSCCYPRRAPLSSIKNALSATRAAVQKTLLFHASGPSGAGMHTAPVLYNPFPLARNFGAKYWKHGPDWSHNRPNSRKCSNTPFGRSPRCLQHNLAVCLQSRRCWKSQDNARKENPPREQQSAQHFRSVTGPRVQNRYGIHVIPEILSDPQHDAHVKMTGVPNKGLLQRAPCRQPAE